MCVKVGEKGPPGDLSGTWSATVTLVMEVAFADGSDAASLLTRGFPASVPAGRK